MESKHPNNRNMALVGVGAVGRSIAYATVHAGDADAIAMLNAPLAACRP